MCKCCDGCECKLFDGDKILRIGNDIYCEACVDDMMEYYEEEYPEDDDRATEIMERRMGF